MRIGLPPSVAATVVAGLLAATPLHPGPAIALTIDSSTQRLTIESSTLLAGRFICDEKFQKCVETVSDKGDALIPEGESAESALERAKKRPELQGWDSDAKAQQEAQKARFAAAKAAVAAATVAKE